MLSLAIKRGWSLSALQGIFSRQKLKRIICSHLTCCLIYIEYWLMLLSNCPSTLTGDICQTHSSFKGSRRKPSRSMKNINFSKEKAGTLQRSSAFFLLFFIFSQANFDQLWANGQSWDHLRSNSDHGGLHSARFYFIRPTWLESAQCWSQHKPFVKWWSDLAREKMQKSAKKSASRSDKDANSHFLISLRSKRSHGLIRWKGSS